MKSEDKNNLSRRKFLGVGLALPFLSMAQSAVAAPASKQEEESKFITMLTAEGKAVRVRKAELKNAKVIEKKMSNQSLLSWLKPKSSPK